MTSNLHTAYTLDKHTDGKILNAGDHHDILHQMLHSGNKNYENHVFTHYSKFAAKHGTHDHKTKLLDEHGNKLNHDTRVLIAKHGTDEHRTKLLDEHGDKLEQFTLNAIKAKAEESGNKNHLRKIEKLRRIRDTK